MKIGILTHFYKSINYGGVLQAYALCRYLNEKGHCTQQILYKHQVASLVDTPSSIFEYLKKIRTYLKNRIYKKKNRQIYNEKELLFAGFRDTIPHTSCVYTKETIKDVVDEFDLFITGSDQVWNPYWYDSTYMLDFVGDKKTKLSYAASMGVNQLKNQEYLYEKNLSSFKGISVRENDAVNILSAFMKREIEVSVDPTLLLTVDEWDVLVKERRVKDHYIFGYILAEDINSLKLAEKFAKRKGLKLVLISDLLGSYRSCDKKICAEIMNEVDPCNFLSLIKYADYIITDSFHACIFSFLYKKEFFAIKRKGIIEMESRLSTLATLFECPERFCIQQNMISLDYILSLPEINYQKEFNLLSELRKKSIEYLNDNIIQ